MPCEESRELYKEDTIYKDNNLPDIKRVVTYIKGSDPTKYEKLLRIAQNDVLYKGSPPHIE